MCAGAHGNLIKSADYALLSYVGGRDYPRPDVAHIENLSASQKALKEKKSPWSSLSIDEKVELYCIQFNESFPEMKGSTNERKMVVSTAVFFIGFAALVLTWEKHCVYASSRTPLKRSGWPSHREDARHKGQPNSGLLSQVGLQQEQMEEVGACHSLI